MQRVERQSRESKPEKIGNVLCLTAWIGLFAQIGFGAIALLMVVFAIAGRNFSQATVLPPGVAPGIGVNLNRGVTPGIGIGIFWALDG